MNLQEVYLMFLSFIHMGVWMYLLFAFALGKHHVYFSLVILLPIIYIVQSLPVHILFYTKFKFVTKNKQYLRSYNDSEFKMTESKRNFMNRLSKIINIPFDEIKDALMIINYYDDLYIMSKIKENISSWFETRSYIDPVSPQGLIIISYIINVFAYVIM